MTSRKTVNKQILMMSIIRARVTSLLSCVLHTEIQFVSFCWEMPFTVIKILCPESEYFKKLKYEEMFSNICKNGHEVIHYCCLCNNRFPVDPDVVFFWYLIGDCPGLRYIGPVLSRTMLNWQPRCFLSLQMWKVSCVV